MPSKIEPKRLVKLSFVVIVVVAVVVVDGDIVVICVIHIGNCGVGFFRRGVVGAFGAQCLFV